MDLTWELCAWHFTRYQFIKICQNIYYSIYYQKILQVQSSKKLFKDLNSFK